MNSIKRHSITRLVTPRPMTEKGPNTGHFVQDLFPCDGPLLQLHWSQPFSISGSVKQPGRHGFSTLIKDIMTKITSLINFSYHTRGLLNVSNPFVFNFPNPRRDNPLSPAAPFSSHPSRHSMGLTQPVYPMLTRYHRLHLLQHLQMTALNPVAIPLFDELVSVFSP